MGLGMGAGAGIEGSMSFLPQVEEFRARDARRGLRIAALLHGHIKRKVVKQTVMTVVYGVTRYGGRLQIEKRLREIDDFPQVSLVTKW